MRTKKGIVYEVLIMYENPVIEIIGGKGFEKSFN